MASPKKYEFEASIRKHKGMDSGYIEFPYDVEKEFDTRGQVKVKASFDGYPYRGSLTSRGLDCHWLIVTQKVRKAIGKDPGDTVHVTIERDMEPRTVEVPKMLQEWLDDHPGEKKFFDALAYTYRKEYVQWITGAKREETRRRRLKNTFEMLKDRVKRP